MGSSVDEEPKSRHASAVIHIGQRCPARVVAINQRCHRTQPASVTRSASLSFLHGITDERQQERDVLPIAFWVRPHSDLRDSCSLHDKGAEHIRFVAKRRSIRAPGPFVPGDE